MKATQQFSLVVIFLILSAGPAFSGDTRVDRNGKMAAPLAEMMFYEAAEQAVEDGYATIIPDTETSKENAQDSKTTLAEQKLDPDTSKKLQEKP
jgi:hypothetical protein